MYEEIFALKYTFKYLVVKGLLVHVIQMKPSMGSLTAGDSYNKPRLAPLDQSPSNLIGELVN